MTPEHETPLIKKLGIRPGLRISLDGEPDHYLAMLGELPKGVKLFEGRAADLDLVHLFATSRAQLVERLPRVKARIKPDGMIWISWPKMGSPLAGDLKESVVREIGLANGMVDVKVAAIDQNWSALKFVYRLKDRA